MANLFCFYLHLYFFCFFCFFNLSRRDKLFLSVCLTDAVQQWRCLAAKTIVKRLCNWHNLLNNEWLQLCRTHATTLRYDLLDGGVVWSLIKFLFNLLFFLFLLDWVVTGTSNDSFQNLYLFYVRGTNNLYISLTSNVLDIFSYIFYVEYYIF